jgi:hypothetical protein
VYAAVTLLEACRQLDKRQSFRAASFGIGVLKAAATLFRSRAIREGQSGERRAIGCTSHKRTQGGAGVRIAVDVNDAYAGSGAFSVHAVGHDVVFRAPWIAGAWREHYRIVRSVDIGSAQSR